MKIVKFLLPLFALSLSLAFFSACGEVGEECVHEYGEWITTKEASCLEEGSRERACLKCGAKESDSIAALGHLFDDRYTVDIKPTTSSEGQKSRHCLHFGCAEKTDILSIPALPAKPADQTKPEEEQPDPQPSDPTDPEPSDPTDPEPSDPTDPEPDPEPEPEPDPEPDPEPEPEPSEPEPKPQQPSQADPSMMITYRIYINRWNGYKIGRTSIGFHMEDEAGKTVYTGQAYVTPGSAAYDETECMFCDVKLPMGSYTIHIDSAGQGIVYEESYPISYLDGTYPYKWAEQYPTVDIRLGCDMEKGSDEIKYGNVLKDFSIHTVNKGDVTLKGLLEDHDLVLLNFFYDDCIPCREEADAIRAVKDHKNVAVVCINTVQAEETVLSGVEKIFKYDTEAFYVAASLTNNNIFKRVDDDSIYGRVGVPCNVFIDKYGFVCKLTGGLHTEWMERIINFNTDVSPRKAEGTLFPAESKESAKTCLYTCKEAILKKFY